MAGINAAEFQEMIKGATETRAALGAYLRLYVHLPITASDEMRGLHFARDALPLMIESAKGELGTPENPVFDFHDLSLHSWHKSTLLDLEPMALDKLLEKGFQSARKLLAWAAPHLPPEARRFLNMEKEAGSFRKLANMFHEQRKAVQDRENTIEIVHKVQGKKIDSQQVPEDLREKYRLLTKDMDQFQRLKTNTTVKRVRIEAVIINYALPSFKGARKKYEVSDVDGNRQIISPDKLESQYDGTRGVFMERDNRAFFIPVNLHQDYGLNTTYLDYDDAMEVLGVSAGLRKECENKFGHENLPKDYNPITMLRMATEREIDGSEPNRVCEIRFSQTGWDSPIVIHSVLNPGQFRNEPTRDEVNLGNQLIDDYLEREKRFVEKPQKQPIEKFNPQIALMEMAQMNQQSR